ncbi:phage antirepressor KilAC domain-containing protein [Robertmurraya sp. FSL W8-0741]|uniref:Rha family transcriptional regulator n=1 Tax=Robertmurraya sp. FSL W8-0741 TaxID=2954629 RepID=UPI0030FC82C6
MKQLVFIENNQAVTDSLTVAQVFNKEHKNVLADIRKQIEYAGEDFAQLNFQPGSYLDKNKQSRPKINLTEDAFTLIAMSYNTKEAVQMKIKFIQEFKKIKEKLSQPYKLPTNFKEALQLLLVKEEEKEQLEAQNLMLEQRVAEYEPKITYLDQILASSDSVTITQIAADYGMSAQRFNKILNECGVQYKVNGQWILYGKHKSEGYTKSKTTDVKRKDGTNKVVMNTQWTQKGRLFIYDTLKQKGIYPVMDVEVDRNLRLVSGNNV